MFHASHSTVQASTMKKNPIVPTRSVTKSASFWVGFNCSRNVSLGFLTLEKCFSRSWTISVIWSPRSLPSTGGVSSTTVHHPLLIVPSTWFFCLERCEPPTSQCSSTVHSFVHLSCYGASTSSSFTFL